MRNNVAPAVFTGFLLTVFAMTPTAGHAASSDAQAKAPERCAAAPTGQRC